MRGSHFRNGEDANHRFFHTRGPVPHYSTFRSNPHCSHTPTRDSGSTDNAITPSSPQSSLSRYSSLELSTNPGNTICNLLHLVRIPFLSLVPPSTYLSEDHLRTYLVPLLLTIRTDICYVMALPCEKLHACNMSYTSSLEAQEIDSFGLNDDFLGRKPL